MSQVGMQPHIRTAKAYIFISTNIFGPKMHAQWCPLMISEMLLHKTTTCPVRVSSIRIHSKFVLLCAGPGKRYHLSRRRVSYTCNYGYKWILMNVCSSR